MLSCPADHYSVCNSLVWDGTGAFAEGTLTTTKNGDVPIENLRPGDLVQTFDNGLQPLVWCAKRQSNSEDLQRDAELRPVALHPGAVGSQAPLFVSRRHCMLIKTPDNPPLFVRAVQTCPSFPNQVSKIS